MPASVHRSIYVSAARYAPQGLLALQGSAAVANLDFPVAAIGLPLTETNRKVNNLTLFLTGGPPLNVKAIFAGSNTAKINVTFANSLTVSNAPPLSDSLSTAPMSPLNALVNADVAQTFRLQIQKSMNFGVDFSRITDAVLGIEYSADLI